MSLEQKLKDIIGNLIFTNAALTQQIEDLQAAAKAKEEAEKDKKIPDEA